MSKQRIFYHILSATILTVPNLTYLGLNFDVLKEVNAISLTMTALLILSVIGLGTLAHLKLNGGVWAILVGIFILALSNLQYIAGVALVIEGGGMALDGYVFKPLIQKAKIKEFEKNGGSITYTKEFK